MLKQVFLAHFEPEVTRFGPWKMLKCLKWAVLAAIMGQKWSQTRFSKSNPGPNGVHKQVK